MPPLVKNAALALVAALLLACEARRYRDAQLVDSPEAYEAFLAEHPDFPDADFVRERIDELRWVDAKDLGTPDAFRDYLRRMPEGRHRADAERAEDLSAFRLALDAGTVGDLQAYLRAYPAGQHRERAAEAMEARAYLGSVTLAGVTLDRRDAGIVTLGVVHSNGDRALAAVELDIRWLDREGTVLLRERAWVLGGSESTDAAVPPGGQQSFRWVPDVPPEGSPVTADASLRAVRLAR